MPYVITELCTRDGACAEVCPVACIHTTPDAPQFYIDPDICIECEQCVVVCPVDAVFLDIELPPEYRSAEDVNAAFFRENKEPVEQISYAAALDMIHAAEAYAQRMGHRISVAVVDGTGAPVALSRMDGADPRSPELALNKAYTATVYALPTDTTRLAHRSLTVMSRGKIMAGAGGLAIVGAFGAATIGAIGVAGAGNDGADALCSQAGLNALNDAHH
ncbi:MAG: heme-binding protein [Chloroflexota bacterium]|nr:heme-binding protein [Chloroflexota bacterium]